MYFYETGASALKHIPFDLASMPYINSPGTDLAIVKTILFKLKFDGAVWNPIRPNERLIEKR